MFPRHNSPIFYYECFSRALVYKCVTPLMKTGLFSSREDASVILAFSRSRFQRTEMIFCLNFDECVRSEVILQSCDCTSGLPQMYGTAAYCLQSEDEVQRSE